MTVGDNPALKKLRQRMASWRPALVMQQDSTFKKKSTRNKKCHKLCPSRSLILPVSGNNRQVSKTVWEQKLLCPFAGSEVGDRHGLQSFGKVCLHQKSGKGEARESFPVQSGVAADTQVGDTTAVAWHFEDLLSFFSPSQSFQHSSRKTQRWAHLQRTTALSVSARPA